MKTSHNLPSLPFATPILSSNDRFGPAKFLDSLGAELSLCGIVGEKSLCLLQEEIDFGEGLVTDILPADVARGIDEKGTVQGNFFKIVVGPVGPEGGEFGIGDEGKGNRVTTLFVGGEGLGEFGLGLRANGDDFQARFTKGIHLGSESLKLLDAMEATETEIEHNHDGTALVVGEGERLARGIG